MTTGDPEDRHGRSPLLTPDSTENHEMRYISIAEGGTQLRGVPLETIKTCRIALSRDPARL